METVANCVVIGARASGCRCSDWIPNNRCHSDDKAIWSQFKNSIEFNILGLNLFSYSLPCGISQTDGRTEGKILRNVRKHFVEHSMCVHFRSALESTHTEFRYLSIWIRVWWANTHRAKIIEIPFWTGNARENICFWHPSPKWMIPNCREIGFHSCFTTHVFNFMAENRFEWEGDMSFTKYEQ